MRSVKDRAHGGGGRKDLTPAESREKAIKQASGSWSGSLFVYDQEAEFRVGDELLEVNLGVRQGEKLRAAYGLKTATNQASAVNTPISLPSWGNIAQICELYGQDGAHRPLATAKADHADAYEQLPLKEEGQPTAVATFQIPAITARYGFIPRTLLFGSTAAVLHYICLSRLLASPVCPFLGIPCVGYYDDYGMRLPYRLADAALGAFTSFNDCLEVTSKRGKSEPGRKIEFLGPPHPSRKEMRGL